VKLLVVERAHQVRVTGRSVNTSCTRVKKDQRSEVKGHGSKIKDHGSMVLVKDRGSRIKGQGSRVMGQVSVLRVMGHGSRVVGQKSRVKGQVSGLKLVRMVTSARGPCDRAICQHITYEGQEGSRVRGQGSVLRVVGHGSRVVGQKSRDKGQVSGLRLVRMVTSAQGPCDRVICQHVTYKGQGSNEKSQGSRVRVKVSKDGNERTRSV